MPIWAVYMKKCYADPELNVSQDEFPVPEGPITIDLSCTGAKDINSIPASEYLEDF
jgi:penicillin-binding protein 1A